ncbi:inositol monophosphatase family protein [Motiliproteus sediminis]|uniref:inositol monophosphatase family protein n=1 Tax=Motiliproteus sediminis TaxID=1468178 RepID=UPI001AEFDAB8|nr:inositol monophosphatase family protein [Motiliproteus sediminis]
MQPTLNIALRAARIAGEQVARAIERLDIIRSEQESVSDFMRDTAAGAEKSVAYHLQKANPHHRVIGFHSGPVGEPAEDSDYQWLVNPIDGLTNFSRSLPSFALTLVCKVKGRAEHVVILNPITGEEYTASRGRGAQLNGKRIRVSPLKSFDDALIGTNYQSEDPESPALDQHLDIFKRVQLLGADVQQNGSYTLTLAYVASGRMDAAWCKGITEWELEPSLLLLQEAGSLSGDFNGGNALAQRGELVAANPKLFKQLLQTIRPTLG